MTRLDCYLLKQAMEIYKTTLTSTMLASICLYDSNGARKPRKRSNSFIKGV